MRETVDIAALNSRVKFDKTDIPFEQRAILGDATETGLIRFAGRYLRDFDQHQKKHPKVFEIPFNSTNKWALVVVRIVTRRSGHRLTFTLQLDKPHDNGVLTAYMKGAPERVLAKCTSYLKDGEMLPITDDFRTAYDDAYNVSNPAVLLASVRRARRTDPARSHTVYGFKGTPCDRLCSTSSFGTRLRPLHRLLENRRGLSER